MNFPLRKERTKFSHLCCQCPLPRPKALQEPSHSGLPVRQDQPTCKCPAVLGALGCGSSSISLGECVCACLIFSFSRLPKWLHLKVTMYLLLNLLIFCISFLFYLRIFFIFIFCNFLSLCSLGID